MQRAVTLRALGARDLPALHSLSAAAGWPHRAQDCAMLLALGHGLAACGADGAILGSAMRWDWSADCATIGMVLVAPDQQGKGLGRRLMQALLDTTQARAVMLNATLAGLALYEKLGFRPIGMIHQHQGTITQVPSRSAKADHPRLSSTAELTALDQAAFGAPRPTLIAHLQAETEIRTTPRGIAARRRFGHGHTIGPVVAETEDEAIDLIAALLRPGFQRIDVPAEAPALRAWLTQAGLAPVDSVTVMTRGDWPRGDGALRRFALASQALG
jgi:GNAT superfamily N-acetyltransferase